MGNKQTKCKSVYDIKEQLGSGNFAVVKLGVHKKTGEKVAIKIIDKSNCEEADNENIQTEVDVMRSISHPNIVCLKDIYDNKDKLYLVLELVTGGELFDRIIQKSHFSEKEASELVKTILDALAYLHSKGVVHRDLKPENLLFANESAESPIKIADFGLAKMASAEKAAVMNTTCGTPGYVAPEVLTGRGYDKGVDVWSLGVILYILLCGFPPFYNENQAALFEQIKRGSYDFPEPYWSKVSDNAKDLVRKMMTVDPKKRFTIDQCLAHPWIANSGENKSEEIEGLVQSMKKWNTSRLFRKAAMGVMATNRMAKLMSGMQAAAIEEGHLPAPAK